MAEDKKTETPATEAPAATTAPEAPAEGLAQAAPAGAPAAGQAPAGPDLTVSDLQALKTIIDVSSSRGTFKAAEMAVVGNTYNRLTQFLEAIQKSENKEGAPAQTDAPKK